MRSIVALFALLSLCSGCVFRRGSIAELHPAVAHQSPAPELRSEITPNASGTHVASLGDTMFVIKRYRLSIEEFACTPPRELNAIPPASSWSATHSWDNNVVYTSPQYYDGDLGIVATRDGKFTEIPHILQVKGVKTGRRWDIKAQSGGEIFRRAPTDIDEWGVRYGGHRSNSTEFQIVNRANANVSQIVQNLLVSDEDLNQGVVIKGVLVKIIGQQERGTVTFTIEDLDVKNK